MPKVLERAGALFCHELGQDLHPHITIVNVAQHFLNFAHRLKWLLEAVIIQGREDFHGITQALGGDAHGVEFFYLLWMVHASIVRQHFFQAQ